MPDDALRVITEALAPAYAKYRLGYRPEAALALIRLGVTGLLMLGWTEDQVIQELSRLFVEQKEVLSAK